MKFEEYSVGDIVKIVGVSVNDYNFKFRGCTADITDIYHSRRTFGLGCHGEYIEAKVENLELLRRIN